MRIRALPAYCATVPDPFVPSSYYDPAVIDRAKLLTKDCLTGGDVAVGGNGGNGGNRNGNSANGGNNNSGDFSGNGGIAVGNNGNGGNGGNAVGGESL